MSVDDHALILCGVANCCLDNERSSLFSAWRPSSPERQRSGQVFSPTRAVFSNVTAMPGASALAAPGNSDPVHALPGCFHASAASTIIGRNHRYVVRRLFAAIEDVSFTVPQPLRRLAALKARVAVHTGVDPEFQILVSGGKCIDTDEALAGLLEIEGRCQAALSLPPRLLVPPASTARDGGEDDRDDDTQTQTILHLVCSPAMQRSLQIYVTVVRGEGRGGIRGGGGHGFNGSGLQQRQYTVEANSLLADLCSSVEHDFGIPAHEQCLVVGRQHLASSNRCASSLLVRYTQDGVFSSGRGIQIERIDEGWFACGKEERCNDHNFSRVA